MTDKSLGTFINPFTDFGFKKIFGSEESKPLLISFLNDLLPIEDKIVSLEFKNIEKLGILEEDRRATVEGEVEKQGVYQLEDILRNNALEERIYRFRCVEAWSMVIPWIGFPLAQMLQRFKPTSKAKYVEFTTLYNPDVMTGQRTSSLNFPYIEGLRIDEAMHPLAFMATGMYNDTLPKQNGAPLRLVVPWKYGFKSIKAIVKIRFSETMPLTVWSQSDPTEYGFYANVNPEISHPRWSQKRERVLGGSVLGGSIFNMFAPKRNTELFNGYGKQVANLYAGMDLTKNF